ncbi:hypothetical protein MGN70_007360 [Eutypa lata]|nr:hypothetical protein MGN70_007360 [Eutypa lata]
MLNAPPSSGSSYPGRRSEASSCPIATSKMLNNKHVSRVRVDAEDHRLLHATAARIRERDRQIADPAARHQLLVLGGFQEPEVPDPSRRVVFHAPGPEHPDFFIPTYAAIRGTKATLAGSLFAILNAVSTFGCIIPGVVILFMDMVATDAVLIVYSVVFGFWSGTIMPGAPAALSVCSDDLQKMGPYLGMALFIMSFGNLIGPPINGVLVERYRGFFQAALLSGSITVFGGLVAIFAKFHTARGVFGRT